MKADSSANKAYAEIRRKIISGQIIPGVRLKEDAWAQKLMVGRMAVREALTRLLGEGLLSLGLKGGYFVAGLTKENVEETKELRQVLEIGALELSAKKITPVQIQQLEKICDDFTAMAKQGYFAGACEADVKFHEVLIESSQNDKLIFIYRHSHIPLFHKNLGRSELFLTDHEQTDKEHRQIVEAIKANDFDLAKKVLIQHFERGASFALDME